MIPRHIGFIMDGNGRWATEHGLSRADGYPAGLLALRRVIQRCKERGIEAVSVYAFSTENWARPDSEKEAIFKVVDTFNRNYEGDTKITYSGDIASLPDYLEDSICEVEDRTKDNQGTVLNICFNYGGREDILHAAEICFSHGNFTKENFERALSSSHLPAIDCIVRTGGEMRLSNFMLYESAYAELIFLVKNWPDMDETDVDKIIELFEKRNRTFGA